MWKTRSYVFLPKQSGAPPGPNCVSAWNKPFQCRLTLCQNFTIRSPRQTQREPRLFNARPLPCRHGDLWSEKSFANVSEVAGDSRIKM
jgi:hypothetical protein